MRQTLPTCSPAEARAVLERMRRRGWTEEEVADLILPFMPSAGPFPERRPVEGAGPRPTAVPPKVSTAWLDQHLPSMDRAQIRLLVEELERRGWSSTELAVAVLPHLLPKLPREDADALLEGLKRLGMTDAEVARLAPAGP